MTITTTFDPPLLSDSREEFDAKAFALVADLGSFATEANALQADVNAKQASATAAALDAGTNAAAASAAALDAGTHAAAATTAKNSAESAWDNFDDRYLGPKASNPTLDNDGAALLEGALYWSTTAKEMRTWNGAAWVTTSVANALSRTGGTMTGPARGAVVTDNDLSFDMNASNNFGCTPTGAGTLTFTNIAAGQSGFIRLTNSSNYTISAAATTKIGSAALATISVTGTYLLSYFCEDGVNVYVVNSGALA